MAFCNSCGQMLAAGAKFCAKCGAAQPGSPAPAAPSALVSAPAPAVQPQSGSGVKIVLIIVAVVMALGILGAGTAAFVAWRVARHLHVEEKNGNVRVESPFGTVETSTNPADVARDLGIEIYPGARVLKSGAANVRIGGMHTVAADFESDDPTDKVADFYKSKFPNANVTVAEEDHFTIVSTDKTSLITVSIEPRDNKTLIHVANVSGKGISSSPTN